MHRFNRDFPHFILNMLNILFVEYSNHKSILQFSCRKFDRIKLNRKNWLYLFVQHWQIDSEHNRMMYGRTCTKS